MILLKARVKSMFFDRDGVIRKTTAGFRSRASKLGAYIRRRAKSLIRKRKAISEPGQPPSSHTGVLRDLIFFGYDDKANSLVVGPTPANQLARQDNRFVKGTVPQVLEEGGDVGIFEVQSAGGDWRRADMRSRRRLANRPTRTRIAHIKARPYMEPARKHVMENELPDIWRDSVQA